MTVTNTTGIPLVLAVWAVNDEYDYSHEENYVSATTLLKPTKSILLTDRVPEELRDRDVSDYIAAALGTSIHAGIEKAWASYETNLKELGYPDDAISRIKINPEPEDVTADDISIYIEKRAVKEFNGWKIGGKADFIAEGIVHDNKSTSVYSYILGGHDDDYRMQGSIYRWLMPEIITEDFIRINFVFTDWSKSEAMRKPDTYPQSRLVSKDLPLYSLEETENYIRTRIEQLKILKPLPESKMPNCTDEELWRSAPVWKVMARYDSPRALRNFDNPTDAYAYLRDKRKGDGVVKEFQGEPKRCNYCAAAPICQQRKEYFND